MTEPKHVKRSAYGFALKTIAAALALILIGGVTFLSPKTEAFAADQEYLSAADIYEMNVNSTVGITTSMQTTNYWGYPSSRTASGSGFIITETGYILTNYHVIEGSDEVKVATYDGKSYDAQIIGYDESNDIAVLKIDADGLVPVTIGDSDALRVGDDVLAIGNPLGELTFSLTKGVVSALSRDITIESGISMSLIQTDCAINSGNSGGALFNMNGEVIGITNAKYSSSSSGTSVDNIGFAIPINTLVRIYDSIIENGFIQKSYIGITGQTISDDVKQITGLEGGVRIYEVSEESPAEEAGIQVGDVIVSADGNAIKEFSDLSKLIEKTEPGTEIQLKVYRQGQYVDITVEVGTKTESALKAEEEAEESENDSAAQPQQGFGQDNGRQYGNNYGEFFGNGDMYDFFNYFFR